MLQKKILKDLGTEERFVARSSAREGGQRKNTWERKVSFLLRGSVCGMMKLSKWFLPFGVTEIGVNRHMRRLPELRRTSTRSVLCHRKSLRSAAEENIKRLGNRGRGLFLAQVCGKGDRGKTLGERKVSFLLCGRACVVRYDEALKMVLALRSDRKWRAFVCR